MVGFLDDFIKIVKQRSLGLRSKAKMIGLTVVALTFGIVSLLPALEDSREQTPASRHLSFIRDFEAFTLPAVVVVLLIWLIVAGTSNGVNLADGLDGLATGASVMVFGAYMLVNIWQNNQSCALTGGRTCYEVRDPLDLAVDRRGDHRRLLRLPLVERLARPRSSWATPGRWRSAVRSRASRSSPAPSCCWSSWAACSSLETFSVMLQVTWFKATRALTGDGTPGLPDRPDPPPLRDARAGSRSPS